MVKSKVRRIKSKAKMKSKARRVKSKESSSEEIKKPTKIKPGIVEYEIDGKKMRCALYTQIHKPLISRWFQMWKKLKTSMEKSGVSSRINLPEGISEPALSIAMNKPVVLTNKKLLGKFSVDNYDPDQKDPKKAGLQVKAMSTKSITSFGDKRLPPQGMYFLDFSSMNGTVHIYKIPRSVVDKVKLSSGQTFKQAQTSSQNRKKKQAGQHNRPRFDVIDKILNTKKKKARYREKRFKLN